MKQVTNDFQTFIEESNEVASRKGTVIIMGELSQLPGIGKAIEEQLNQVGILTYEQLKEVGSRQAWLKIKSIDPSACINRLYSLESAILLINKKLLPQEVKSDLKDFYLKFK